MDNEMLLLKSLSEMQSHQLKTGDLLESMGTAILELGREVVELKARINKMEEAKADSERGQNENKNKRTVKKHFISITR